MDMEFIVSACGTGVCLAKPIYNISNVLRFIPKSFRSKISANDLRGNECCEMVSKDLSFETRSPVDYEIKDGLCCFTLSASASTNDDIKKIDRIVNNIFYSMARVDFVRNGKILVSVPLNSVRVSIDRRIAELREMDGESSRYMTDSDRHVMSIAR